MPAVVAVLRAADRPLSTAEITVAMLQARGLDYRGPELTAVSSRVSAILGQLAKKRRVERIRVEGSGTEAGACRSSRGNRRPAS